MAITAGEILWKLSTTAGSAGNANTQNNPQASLGKYISITLFGQTTLNGAINSAVTSIAVTDGATGFPAAGSFNIQIDNEIMTVTAGQGTNSWTVTRGVGGSTAASHSNGAGVEGGLPTSATQCRLWDNVSGDENSLSNVEYRCVFIHNSNASLDLTSTRVWISAENGAGANIAIGLDDVGSTPANGWLIGDAGPQAKEVANEDTAPNPAITFSSPTSKGTGLDLGTIGPGRCKAIWIRRSATNSGAVTGDNVTLRVEGDTAA